MSEELTTEQVENYNDVDLVEMLTDYGEAGFEGIFDELFTVKELGDFAGERNIDISGASKKADIISVIRQYVESLVGGSSSDDTEADTDSESGKLSVSGDASEPSLTVFDRGGDVDYIDEENVVDAVKEHEVVLRDVMARAQDAEKAFEQAIGSLTREIDALKKELKCKGSDATLHGSIDNL